MIERLFGHLQMVQTIFVNKNANRTLSEFKSSQNHHHLSLKINFTIQLHVHWLRAITKFQISIISKRISLDQIEKVKVFRSKRIMSTRRFNKLSTLVLFALVISVVYTCGACGGHYEEEESEHDHHHHHHQHEHHHDHEHDHDHDHHHDHHHHHQHDHDHEDSNHEYHDHDHDHHDHDHNHQHNENHHHEQHHHHQQETPQEHVHTHPKQPQLQMIQTKPNLLSTLKLTPITIFYYGLTSTPQYHEFTQVIPAYNDEFFQKVDTQIQFAYISSEKFKLARPNPSLSIYRNINSGEWLMYRGVFEKGEMLRWVMGNVVDPLREFTGEELDEVLVEGRKGFVLLDFGQFYLLKPKIMISQFCLKFQLTCGKVSHTNKALSMIIQLMRVENQPGVPKLAYWNPKTQQLEIYTKDVAHITETELMQLYSGHESVIPYESELDVAKVIHPETEIIEVKENDSGTQL